jgi:hypothetical protein
MRYDHVLHKVRPGSLVVISLPVALSAGRLEGGREVTLLRLAYTRAIFRISLNSVNSISSRG